MDDTSLKHTVAEICQKLYAASYSSSIGKLILWYNKCLDKGGNYEEKYEARLKRKVPFSITHAAEHKLK